MLNILYFIIGGNVQVIEILPFFARMMELEVQAYVVQQVMSAITELRDLVSEMY